MGRGKNTELDFKNKEILSKRLKEAMKKEKITQSDLASATSIGQARISGYVNGKFLPTEENSRKLAAFFNIPFEEFDPRFTVKKESKFLVKTTEVIEKLNESNQEKVYSFSVDLLDEQNDNVIPFELREKIELPFYGYVSAGKGFYLVDVPTEIVSFPIKQVPSIADFCLRVDGDSMEPTFSHKQIIFVKRQDEILNNSIGVVYLNGEAFLKRVRFNENGTVTLVSLNPKYKDIEVDPDVDSFTVVGKVVL